MHTTLTPEVATTEPTNPLFTPVRVGAVRLPNRFVMAPMTRGRAESDGTPNALMAEYYTQRATAGLIITEATGISPQGIGWLGAPRIYTESHTSGWRLVTDAVHRAGGRIFLQLWHMGRVSHPDFLGGELPVGPSAIAATGETHTPQGKKTYVTPRALEASEIPGIVRSYAAAARLAREAGFDGVEIHAANEYLIDQFLRDWSNQRTDSYGGSIENRARLLIEVTTAVVEAWSPDRVGVRLLPTSSYNSMIDRDAAATFTHAAAALDQFGLAYLHVLEPLPGYPRAWPGERISPQMRAAFHGPFMVNGGYDADKAAAAVSQGEADLISFGTKFLANPDFVERTRLGAELNQLDMATFYSNGAKGYTDYPSL